MDASEMERLKQILPKISAKLAYKKERLIIKMKELGIFKDNVDIFQTLAESNNVEMLNYLKEILKIEGHVLIVRDIEGKSGQAGDYTGSTSEDSTSSADNGSDSICNDLELKSGPFIRELREMREEMRQEFKKGFKIMTDKIEEARAEAREQNEEAKKRESILLELISKLEKDIEKLKQELDDNSQAGIYKADLETLQRNFQELETKHNQLLNKMMKMGKTEKALIERNKQLEKEIAQLKLALISMQVTKSEKGKMYANFAKIDKK